jgi:hypothetical protein
VTQALPELTELRLAVTFKGAHLSLYPHERVPQRRQDCRGLGVVGDCGLEVYHPLAQQVTLGGQCG